MKSGGKVCAKCKEMKHFSEYHKSSRAKDGLKTECKSCRNQANVEYRKRTPKKDYPRKYYEYTCRDCGDTFKRRSDSKADHRYCTPCIKKKTGEKARGRELPQMKKGAYVKCSNCDSDFYKKLSQLKQNHQNHFCSKECQGEWQMKHFNNPNFINSADNRGKNNGRYKHGKRIGGHDRHRGLKKMIIQRDGPGCKLCGTEKLLHVHRLKPGSLGGKYELENCVLVCREHHALVHKEYDKWVSILSKNIKQIS